MDSMDYSFHDSSDTSSSGIPNTSWHPASDVSWPPFYSPHSAASSQPSPDLSLLLPYNQEISFAAFGYGFSAHLSASSSPGVPITQQELFYPPTPSHSSPTGPFALSAHAVESASLVPQRDRGIWFQSRTAAALHRHQGESSSSHIQPTASTPQRGQSLTISRRSPPATLRSRYAFSQPSIDTYSSVGWDAPANNLTVNATPAPVSMSPSASDEASVRQTPPLSQTQSEQSSTAFRNPVESRQASQVASHTSTPRLHSALHQAERRRIIQHRHLQHRNRPSASGSRIPPEGSPDVIDEPLSPPALSSSIPLSRLGTYSSRNHEQSIRSARNSRTDSNRFLVPKWIVDSLEKVDVNELDESDRACVICYNDYHTESPEGNKEVPLRLPKCKHVFGSDCIRKWFKESNSCPYCRDKIRPDIRNTKGSSGAFVNLMRIRGWSAHDSSPEEIYRQVVLAQSNDTSRSRRSVGGRRPVPENAEEQPRRIRQRLSGASDGETSNSVVHGGSGVPAVSFSNGYSRSGGQNGLERSRTIGHRGSSQSMPGHNEAPSRGRLSAASMILPTLPSGSEHLTSVITVPSISNRTSIPGPNDSSRRHANQLMNTQRQYNAQPDGLFPATGDADIMNTNMSNPLDRNLMQNQPGALSTGMASPRLDPMWQLYHGRQWI